MPVPDEVIFGPDTQMKTITYGDVRSMAEADKLKVLKLRLDRFFIEQVDELGKNKEGNVKVYAPFPLALLTCVGIETLGEVMYHSDLCDKSSPEHVHRIIRKPFARCSPKRTSIKSQLLLTFCIIIRGTLWSMAIRAEEYSSPKNCQIGNWNQECSC